MCSEAANFQHNGPCSHLWVSGAKNIKVFVKGLGEKTIWNSCSEAKKRRRCLLVERISQGDPSVCVVESSAPPSFRSWGWQWQEPHHTNPPGSQKKLHHYWSSLCHKRRNELWSAPGLFHLPSVLQKSYWNAFKYGTQFYLKQSDKAIWHETSPLK